jgi:Ala-tRNA(Pro) deacylase
MNSHRVEYDIYRHPRTASSMQTVRVAKIPGERLAKPVILEDDTILPVGGSAFL